MMIDWLDGLSRYAGKEKQIYTSSSAQQEPPRIKEIKTLISVELVEMLAAV